MRVIIFGSTGFFGQNIYNKMKLEYDVIGTTHYKNVNSQFSHIDITDGKGINDLCDRFSPNVIINCTAITDVKKCETNYSQQIFNIEHIQYFTPQRTYFVDLRGQNLKFEVNPLSLNIVVPKQGEGRITLRTVVMPPHGKE